MSRQVDTWNISGYFEAERGFFRSPLGGLVDHCIARSRDSADRAIPRPPWWSYLPQPDAKRGIVGWTGIMYVNETPSATAGGYVVSGSRMAQVGDIDRRLRRVSPLSYQVLAAYHGDRGSRWAAEATRRADGDGPILGGLGPGAIAALYPMTDAGKALLAFERELARANHEDTAGGKAKKGKKGKKERAAAHEAAAQAKAAHEAYRAELVAAIAEKEVEHAKLGDEMDRVGLLVGGLRVEEALAREANRKVPPAVRSKLAHAKRELHAVIAVRAALLRAASKLREQLSYAAVPAPALCKDEEAAAVVRERTRRQAVYAQELQVWQETKADMERVSGRMEHNDPRLPPKPPPPDLPQVPQVSSARTPVDIPYLSDDDQLRVAFTLAGRGGGASSEAARRNKVRRDLLLKRAGDQAALLLSRAWSEWVRAGGAGGPPNVTPHLAPPGGTP